MSSVLSTEHRSFIVALARRIVPATAQLDAAGEAKFLQIIEAAIASRPVMVQRQIGLFLSVLRWLPVLRLAGALDKLPPARQDEVLRWFQEAPVPLVRKGFWGLKVLIYMGYYSRPELLAMIRYTPSRHGNQVLHAARAGAGSGSLTQDHHD